MFSGFVSILSPVRFFSVDHAASVLLLQGVLHRNLPSRSGSLAYAVLTCIPFCFMMKRRITRLSPDRLQKGRWL